MIRTDRGLTPEREVDVASAASQAELLMSEVGDDETLLSQPHDGTSHFQQSMRSNLLLVLSAFASCTLAQTQSTGE